MELSRTSLTLGNQTIKVLINEYDTNVIFLSEIKTYVDNTMCFIKSLDFFILFFWQPGFRCNVVNTCSNIINTHTTYNICSIP